MLDDEDFGKRSTATEGLRAMGTPVFSPDSKFLLTLETDKIRMWRITSAIENDQPGATSEQGPLRTSFIQLYDQTT